MPQEPAVSDGSQQAKELQLSFSQDANLHPQRSEQIYSREVHENGAGKGHLQPDPAEQQQREERESPEGGHDGGRAAPDAAETLAAEPVQGACRLLGRGGEGGGGRGGGRGLRGLAGGRGV